MVNHCVFCKIVNSERNMLEEYDQPIVETNNFIVVTALGQFVEGYVLICTKNHYLNMSTLDNNMTNELQILKDKVRKMFQEIYKKEAIFFEHGAASIKNSEGTCVDHAHLHAIPLDLYDLGIFSSEYLIKGNDANTKSLKNYSKTGNPYFYIEGATGKPELFDAILMPCQYGRRVIARLVNKSNYWDWRKYKFIANMIKTTRQVKTWSGWNNGI
jgi:ATP adenylyltransferase